MSRRTPLHVRLNKPEYLFRPMQLLRRLKHRHAHGRVHVRLPWGHHVEVSADESIGRSLRHLGVYDLAASEVAWRIFPVGGFALDVGANLGYFVSLLSTRGGSSARVMAFEPHPEIFQQLTQNVDAWRSPGGAQVTLRQEAIGEKNEQSKLSIPMDSQENAGLSRLTDAALPTSLGRTRELLVQVVKLDSIEFTTEIDLLKIDVEGAELNAFRGAEFLLKKRHIRNILFEDHAGATSPVLTLLKDAGYVVFRIRRALFGPKLVPAEATLSRFEWEPPNYLATIDHDRARHLLSKPGWKVLASR